MTVDEVRIRDWSSDVCSSDLCAVTARCGTRSPRRPEWRAGWAGAAFPGQARAPTGQGSALRGRSRLRRIHVARQRPHDIAALRVAAEVERSEEHTSELQSLMRISYAVFCLKKKTQKHYSTQK